MITSMMERQLSQFPLLFRSKKIPPEVFSEAKKRVLDTLGCFFGAYHLKAPSLLRDTLTTNTDGPCSLWGMSRQTSAELAAWANGTAVRALDYNDTYLSKEPCHPSDLIPSLWAACELSGSRNQGRRLLEGIILGYDVLCRLCDATSLRTKGWDHVTYLPIASA